MLVDDVRSFRDGRTCRVAGSSGEAVQLDVDGVLNALEPTRWSRGAARADGVAWPITWPITWSPDVVARLRRWPAGNRRQGCSR